MEGTEIENFVLSHTNGFWLPGQVVSAESVAAFKSRIAISQASGLLNSAVPQQTYLPHTPQGGFCRLFYQIQIQIYVSVNTQQDPYRGI